MVNIKDFLKLIRLQNLLIVAITMVLMRYFVIAPILGLLPYLSAETGAAEALVLQFGLGDFIVLVISTVLITAAGYVINDYFDIRTDLVNRGKVIVGTKITRRKAMMWHNILNIVGIVGGFYVSWRIGFLWFGIFFALVSGLLYFYSATYKKQLLLGNIIVSMLTASVPFMVVVFEFAAIHNHYSPLSQQLPSLNILFYWVGGFSLFAFVASIIREIVKDMEDLEGDRAYGSNSIPIAFGFKASRIVVLTLTFVLIAMLGFVWYFHLNDTLTLIYILTLITTPLIIAMVYIIRNKSIKNLHRASILIKIAMLGGVFYSLVVYYIINFGIV